MLVLTVIAVEFDAAVPVWQEVQFDSPGAPVTPPGDPATLEVTRVMKKNNARKNNKRTSLGRVNLKCIDVLSYR